MGTLEDQVTQDRSRKVATEVREGEQEVERTDVKQVKYMKSDLSGKPKSSGKDYLLSPTQILGQIFVDFNLKTCFRRWDTSLVEGT